MYLNALILAITASLTAGCVTLPPQARGIPFDWQQDTFAFANETVWRYRDGSRVADPTPATDQTTHYMRRCFVMAAGAVQFWKFARFDPKAAPMSDKELARQVRAVRDTPAWDVALPPEKRIVFPGYANLRDLSERKGKIVRANLGAGWTTYFQTRKYSMPFVPSHKHQERMHEQLREWLRRGQPMIVWLYNFPSVNINHAVTVFGEAPPPAPGKFAYRVYDPNYTDRPHTLQYDPAAQTFSYEKTFYFVGGPVHVRTMYLNLIR